MGQDMIDLEEAEKRVSAHAKDRIKEKEIKDIDIESSELDQTGEIPVYKIQGFAIIKKSGKLGRGQRTMKKPFRAQINAVTGKLISFVEEKLITIEEE